VFAACGVEEESKIGRVAVVEILRLKLSFSAKAGIRTDSQKVLVIGESGL